jgi:hypothetical protein
MSDRLAEEIAALPSLDIAKLIKRWESVLKEPAPKHLRKQILLPLLAYKLQERTHGGPSPELKLRLRKLAKSFESNPEKAAAQFSAQFNIKPGTRLIRKWQGTAHHVTVSEKGFEYKGQRYKSPSQIARSITGTRWSGPLFFGLKQSAKEAKKG